MRKEHQMIQTTRTKHQAYVSSIRKGQKSNFRPFIVAINQIPSQGSHTTQNTEITSSISALKQSLNYLAMDLIIFSITPKQNRRNQTNLEIKLSIILCENRFTTEENLVMKWTSKNKWWRSRINDKATEQETGSRNANTNTSSGGQTFSTWPRFQRIPWRKMKTETEYNN